MAYGGTAKTYATWQLISEPFEENKKLYIYVIKPGTSTQKKVRWYEDAEHARLMPGYETSKRPFYSLFGFENEDDYVFCIRAIDLTEEEETCFFHNNWTRGGRWVMGAFFGGVWYAPKDEPIPPISKAGNVFRATWAQFKKEGQKNSEALGYPKASSWWF